MRKYKAIILFILLLSAVVCPASGEQKVITILHVNDFHGFAEPYRPFGSNELLGGIAALSHEVEKVRAERPVLLLAAGDMIQGNNWANLFFGESVIRLMNEMRFDAMVLGNHEFDFGQEVLKKRISEAQFPVLGANVSGLDPVRPYVIKEIQGIRIAVIGVVTDDVPVTTHPGNVSGLEFLPAAGAVGKYLALLKDKADIFIVLSHIGYTADRELAGRVKGITAIIGGHSHTRVEKPAVINNTVVLQAWEHAKALGELDLYIEGRKVVRAEGRLIDIRPAGDIGSPGVVSLVEDYKDRVDALLNEPVGEALTDLDGEKVRTQETNLGDLIADIFRQTAGADVAIIGGGSIRTSIKKGEIRLKHVYSVAPFNNYIVAVRMTGRQIREALEHGVSAVGEGAGRFPQVSGLSYTYSASELPGRRIREVIVSGREIDPEHEYAVATDDFLAAGGDGYKVFGAALRSAADFTAEGGVMKGEKLLYSNPGRWVRDVIADYIRSAKKIAPKEEGRIREEAGRERTGQ